ncbi:MAG: cell filamentation protein Fic, partial [Deltaproteobacteria bacterium]
GEVARVLSAGSPLLGHERDEREVLGYHAAMDYLASSLEQAHQLTESYIRQLHALVMAGGRASVTPTPYRDGQNVIRDARTGRIVYMPPTAEDVSPMMGALVTWLHDESTTDPIPCPIRAAVAHYQMATIHPYYDGNGRTARLIATVVLHQGGYDFKGVYSLDEYYARDLARYYEALSVGPSHNYYEGRREADITDWIAYFCGGMAAAVQSVRRHAIEAHERGASDGSKALRELDSRQRMSLSLFEDRDTVTARDLAELIGVKPRTARLLCQKWVAAGFWVVVDPSRKARTYALAPRHR